MSEPRVAVVVAARDAAPGVASLLAALGEQTLPAADFEVVVVDDGSSEPLRADPPARVLRRDRSGGAYVARNQGIAETSAPVVAITDADCRPRADWLERGLAAIETAEAGLVGGRIAMTLSPRPTLAELVDVARGLDQRRCVEWGFAATANVFVRRTVFDTIGPFNERLRSGGDDEFSRRSVAAGFGLRYAEDAVVEHEPRRRPGELWRKSFRVGRGHGHLLHHGAGPARDRPRLWTTPSAWRPRHGLLGAETLHEQGVDPGPLRRVALDVAQYTLLQLPEVVGEAVGDLEQRLGGR